MTAAVATAAAASALALVGCGDEDVDRAGDSAPTAEANETRAASAPPSGGAEIPPRPGGDDAMRWNFSRTAAGPKLAYGEPATDNVRLMLRCPPGGDSVLLSFHRTRELADAQPRDVAIEAGGEIHRTTIDVSESQLGGVTIEAQAPVSAAPFRRMSAGRPLTLHWGDRAISVPAGGARQDQIDAFFEACGPF